MNAKTTEDFVISRTFDAPRALMFKLWTDPKYLQNWHMPKDFSVLKAEGEYVAGGHYHYGIKSPDGQEMWGKSYILEVISPERLVYINTFSDADGGLSRHPFSPNWPQKLLTTVTFAEENGKTTVTIRWAPYESSEIEIDAFDAARPNLAQGWTGTLENLTEYVASLK